MNHLYANRCGNQNHSMVNIVLANKIMHNISKEQEAKTRPVGKIWMDTQQCSLIRHCTDCSCRPVSLISSIH